MSWDTAWYEPTLSTESVSEPVESERFRVKPPDVSTFVLRVIRSSLKIFPKACIIMSTTGPGVQGGKAQAEITAWEPRTTNFSSFASPNVNRSRRAMHTGQERFDTPIVRPKIYFYEKKKVRVEGRNEIGDTITAIRFNTSEYTSSSGAGLVAL